MKPSSFDYCRPDTVQEAVTALVQADGDGKIIAGGQSLVPVLAMRLGAPRILIDINRIPGMAGIDRNGADRVRIGALVRHRALQDQPLVPLLAEAASWIGHTAIRTRGTAGGSIAHADPAAELPVVVAALDARIQVDGPDGQRSISAADFFVGPLETSLRDTEIVTAIELPIPDRWGFAELSRRHGDFGLVTVAAAQVGDHYQLAIGGVGPVPIRPREAEQILIDGPLTIARVREAAKAAAATVTAGSDIHASGAYRVAMTEEFTRRALLQLVGEETKGVA